MIKILVIKQEYPILAVTRNIDFAWLPWQPYIFKVLKLSDWKQDFSWPSYYSLSENTCFQALTRTTP